MLENFFIAFTFLLSSNLESVSSHLDVETYSRPSAVKISPELNRLPNWSWNYAGCLSSDGSISTKKLLEEKDPQADSLDQGSPQSRPISYPRIPDPPAYPELLSFPRCPAEYRDHIPCLNASGLRGPCLQQEQNFKDCVIPTPADYVPPFKWPASEFQVRIANIPNVPLLRNSTWRSWVKVRGSTLTLQQGDPNFPEGTAQYLSELLAKVAGLSIGEKVRVVLDVGCGSGNLGVDLASRGVITISIPGDPSCYHGVQLILERGYPSLVHYFGESALPYPNEAFDLIHCAACHVKWLTKDGLKLTEADRLLKTGGFFVLVNPQQSPLTEEAKNLTEKLCWTLVQRNANILVWQKLSSRWSLNSVTPSICNGSTQDQISREPSTERNVLADFDAEQVPWPKRLQQFPSTLSKIWGDGSGRAREETYLADLNFWKENVGIYVDIFGKPRVYDIRNVLDMNAAYGGFAAAVLLQRPTLEWWVLNVVSSDLPDRLAFIFHRGLIGVHHDWCTPLQLYPRSFDLIHAFSLAWSKQRCSIVHVLLEVDRLLRPGGFAIVRDFIPMLSNIQNLLSAFHWKCVVKDSGSGPKGKIKLLCCQKAL